MDDDVIRIPLRARDGSVRAWAIVDREDADLAEWRWSVLGRSIVMSARGYTEYAYQGTHGWKMHRVILERVIGRVLRSDEMCDHIDGNGLDNRRSNLRVATHGQNMSNRRASGRSRFLGVHWDTERGAWRVQIASKNLRIRLGRYPTEEDAARAYDRAAREHHGEFARLNFPDGGDA